MKPFLDRGAWYGLCAARGRIAGASNEPFTRGSNLYQFSLAKTAKCVNNFVLMSLAPSRLEQGS